VTDIPGTDIRVGVLDEDVPCEISFAKLLPADYLTYLPAEVANPLLKLPVLRVDQEQKALVAEWSDIGRPNSSQVAGTFDRPPSGSLRVGFAEDTVVGDSGKGAFLVVDGELVLLSTMQTATGTGAYGPFYATYISDINSKIAFLDGGSPTGYQVTTLDMTTFAPS
jgi:hypothetical protein